MIGQPLRRIAVACAGIGILLSQDGQAQGGKPADGPAYVLVSKSARRVKAGLTIEFKAPKFVATEWSVYVGQLPELAGQVDVKTTLSPRGKAARDLSDLARPVLYAKIPSVGQRWRQEITARVDHEATLLERRLERRTPGDPEPPPVAALDPKTRRLAMASDHQFDYQAGPFQAWLADNKLRREPGESEIDFARKAFLVVRKDFQNDEAANVEHLASRVCQLGKSDYTGLTAVYVAALRGNGIPTRVLSGRMVLYNGKPARSPLPHARAEFYAQGVGWIPADPAGAIRLGLPTDGLESFGHDPGDFLTNHLETDVVVDTYFGPKTVESFHNPAWWVKGTGTFDDCTTKIDVTVEVEPVDLAEVLARQNARPIPKKTAVKAAK